MKHMLDVIMKLCNIIRSQALTRRQFQEFLDSVQSEYTDILSYIKVRWLSAERFFKRVWELKEEIISFMHEKQMFKGCEMQEDTA